MPWGEGDCLLRRVILSSGLLLRQFGELLICPREALSLLGGVAASTGGAGGKMIVRWAVSLRRAFRLGARSVRTALRSIVLARRRVARSDLRRSLSQ